jgi:hypothetical protein
MSKFVLFNVRRLSACRIVSVKNPSLLSICSVPHSGLPSPSHCHRVVPITLNAMVIYLFIYLLG